MILNRQDFLEFRACIQQKIDLKRDIVISSEELRIFDLGEIQYDTENTKWFLTKEVHVVNFLNSFKVEYIYKLHNRSLTLLVGF